MSESLHPSGAEPASVPAATPAARPHQDSPEFGPNLCKWLYAATKLGGLWGYDGKVAQEAIASLTASLRDNGARCGETVLRVASEQVFLNEQRLRMDFAGMLAFRYLVDLFTSHAIGEIRVGGNPSDKDIRGLLKALNGVPKDCEEPRLEMEKLLQAEGVADVSVGPPRELDEGADDRQVAGIRDASVESYFRAIYVAKQILASKEKGGTVEVRKAKRVVHSIADLLERDESTLLALIQLKNFGDYNATHATNTAVLAMAMGRRLEMTKTLLGELGVAALLCDAGRCGEAADAAALADAADDHARRGARLLLKDMGFADGSLRLVLAARHHHEDVERAGGRLAPLAHRIIRIADFYDTATTPAGRGRPSTPAKNVVRAMLKDGAKFDAKLVKVLASVVGQFPLGTLVHLDTGENAVVCGRNPHFDSPARPIVKVLVDEDGESLKEPKTVDLSKWDREKQKFAHSIVESYAPSEIYTDPASYLKTI